MAESGLRGSCGRLIDECLDRESGPGGGELPVIVFLGPRGSGKTTLIEEVAENAAASFSLPFAQFDGTEQPDTEVWEIAAQIARRVMGVRWPQFAPVRLPRVVLGNLALSLDPALGQEEAEQELYELVRGRRGIPDNARTLREIFDLIGSGLPMLPPFSPLISTLIDRVSRGRRLVELLERKGMDWYRDRLGPDGLIDLARAAGTESGAEKARQIICEALLEDLREGWSRRWRPWNCLFLLDNADSASGRAFLRALTAARTHRAETSCGGDPLLVVATSGSWQDMGRRWNRPGSPQPLATDSACTPRPVRRAGYGDWLTSRAESGRDRWWYPVLLPGLDRTGIARLREATRARPGSAHTRLVQALTGGHPLAATHLLEAMAALEKHDEAGKGGIATEARLRALPFLERTHGQHPFGDFPHDLDDLIASSAAPNLDDADDAGLMSRRWRSAIDELGDRLWLLNDPEQDMAPVIHPWLRRLLLAELARRRNRDGTLWDTAHERLETLYTARDQSHMVMRHRLARVDTGEVGLDRFEEVVDFLDKRFDKADMTEWITYYNHITSAPNRLPATTSLDDLYGLLVPGPHGIGRAAVVRGVIVDRWFLSDPGLDPLGRGRRSVGDGLRLLARYATRGRTILLNEARRYDREDDDE